MKEGRMGYMTLKSHSFRGLVGYLAFICYIVLVTVGFCACLKLGGDLKLLMHYFIPGFLSCLIGVVAMRRTSQFAAYLEYVSLPILVMGVVLLLDSWGNLRHGVFGLLSLVTGITIRQLGTIPSGQKTPPSIGEAGKRAEEQGK